MKKWRVALVLPQAHWVLEARLRGWRSTQLFLPSAFFIYLIGAVAGSGFPKPYYMGAQGYAVRYREL